MNVGRDSAGRTTGRTSSRHWRPRTWLSLDVAEEGKSERSGGPAVHGVAGVSHELHGRLFEEAFELLPAPAAVVGLDDTILHANESFCRLCARSADDLRRRRLAEIVDVRECDRMPDDETGNGGSTVAVLRRPDARRIDVEITTRLLLSPARRPRASLVVLLPQPAPKVVSQPASQPAPASWPPTIFEIAEARDAAAADSDDADGPPSLREEFETFCRTVSQSFRNSLRVIEGYADIVLEDARPSLDPVMLRHLATIREQSRRLSAIVDDTLLLARVASHPLRRETVDLSALAVDAAAVVRAESHAHEVQLRVGPGLVVEADQALASQLLHRLFHNAFRFARAAETPLVEFGRTQVDGKTVHYVRDNGSGFDMALAYKLFLPFETLHEGSELAGRGVGLAEVERIIARHHGEVWAKAAPGRGATFYFTLPDASDVTSPPNS